MLYFGNIIFPDILTAISLGWSLSFIRFLNSLLFFHNGTYWDFHGIFLNCSWRNEAEYSHSEQMRTDN